VESCSAEDWEAVPTHPDPERDLGYEMLDWDVVRASNGSDRLIFLPQDDDMLKDDAFIIVDPELVCDVDARQ
jgi:hypothetical protein